MVLQKWEWNAILRYPMNSPRQQCTNPETCEHGVRKQPKQSCGYVRGFSIEQWPEDRREAKVRVCYREKEDNLKK